MSLGADAASGPPVVTVSFSSTDRQYEPFEVLEARYTVSLPPGSSVHAVEQSVLWYTEGKGEEDLGVWFFERITEPSAVRAVATSGIIKATLPGSPLSYEGMIVKIRWCVRLRLFFEEGRDFVSEHVFECGHVPIASLVST